MASLPSKALLPNTYTVEDYVSDMNLGRGGGGEHIHSVYTLLDNPSSQLPQMLQDKDLEILPEQVVGSHGDILCIQQYFISLQSGKKVGLTCFLKDETLFQK